MSKIYKEVTVIIHAGLIHLGLDSKNNLITAEAEEVSIKLWATSYNNAINEAFELEPAKGRRVSVLEGNRIINDNQDF